jgi:hypothetical protein
MRVSSRFVYLSITDGMELTPSSGITVKKIVFVHTHTTLTIYPISHTLTINDNWSLPRTSTPFHLMAEADDKG